MAQNYKEQVVNSTAWTRCKGISITNPLPGTEQPGHGQVIPTVYFQEEKIVPIDGVNHILNADVGVCSKVFNPTDVIDILDYETGISTGTTITHGEVYQILYSLYIQSAFERDAAVIALAEQIAFEASTKAAAIVAEEEAVAAQAAAAVAEEIAREEAAAAKAASVEAAQAEAIAAEAAAQA